MPRHTDLTVPSPRRRGFLARLAALGVGYTLFGRRDLHAATRVVAGGPDLAWLDALTGRHRTTFDVDTHRNGNALAQAKSFLDAWHDSFGVEGKDINLVMGVRGTGIPIVLGDEVWAKYRLGEQYGITDPHTRAPAVRNLYTDAHVRPGGPVTAEQTIEALRKRGVTFLVCRNTIAGATRKLVAAGMGPADEVRASLAGGIVPGVIIVPAMIVAFTQMQERGVAYVYAG